MDDSVENSVRDLLFQLFDSGWKVGTIEASHAPISHEELRKVAAAQFAEKDALISRVIDILKDSSK
jgi:hypothetical protein